MIKPNFFTDRRYRIALVLLLVWLISIFHFGLIKGFPTVASSVLIATVLDFLINRLIRKLSYFPVSGLVSGLLVGLIIDPLAGYPVILSAATLAVLSKHVITFKVENLRRHLFNPAAFGIIAVSVLFGNQAGWWAVSWWPQFYLILLPTAGYVIYKIGRAPLVVSFLVVYLLFIFFVTKNLPNSFQAILDSTVILFALVMLPEPQSSPATGIWKYGFGLLVGAIVIMMSLWRGVGLDPLLFSLLSADLISFIANGIKPSLNR